MQPLISGNYSVCFSEYGYQALNLLISAKKYSSIFIISDVNTNEYCSPKLLSSIATDSRIEIIELEAGETVKNIETCIEIWNILIDLGADRKSLIINLGGGVISDLGGFAASTFKRGIDFINIPTTLLGMVDASIGGKNGIDFGNLKNQIGTITNPQMVIIDAAFLDTLPQNEMRSGLAEMMKHGLIADKQYWDKFTAIEQLDTDDLDLLIHGSVKIKNDIVMQDPTENGIRKSLNFGHTLGHAIEGYFMENAEKETLLHGEAVAAGMILESYISMEKKLLSADDYNHIKKNIKKIFADIIFEQIDVKAILEFLIHDKKNEYGKVNFVLLSGIGQVEIDQQVENDMISRAFEDYKL
ncbi:MAG TPA: 3-dehydroquinate synthase [Flavobacterium sp.]